MNDPLRLQPNEKVFILFRRHWFILFLKLFGTFVCAVLPFLAYAYFAYVGVVPEGFRAAHVFEYLAAFWLLIIWWTVAGIWTKYYLEVWAVTNLRIIRTDQQGLFDRDVTVWGIDRIQQASVRIGNIIETFLDFGMLEIQTASQSDPYERIYGVPHPDKVREVIMTQASRVGELEEANRNQEQLLHTISHEVKSYLTKDAASLAYIAEGASSGEVKTFAQAALSETRKGVSAVMALLGASDTKTGTMRQTLELFDLRPVLEELVTQFKPVAERKGLAFTFTGDHPVYAVRGDKIKMRDLVFRNLVDNALRYTSRGSVKVVLTKAAQHVVCQVIDTGVGIPAEDMPKLFTAGGKGAHASETNPDSTGFGLASAKQVLDAHGGTIEVRSEGAGKGSTFIVTLPLAG